MDLRKKLNRFAAAFVGMLAVCAVAAVAHATLVTGINSNCGATNTLPVALQMACMRTMQWQSGYYACTGTAASAQCDLAFGSSSVTQVRVNNCNSNYDTFSVPGYGTFQAGYKCSSGLSGSLGSSSRSVWKGTVPTNSQFLVFKDGGGVLREYSHPAPIPNQFHTYGL